MYVCLCLGISDKKIKELAQQGAGVCEIQKSCKIGTSCGVCVAELRKLLRNANSGQ